MGVVVEYMQSPAFVLEKFVHFVAADRLGCKSK
jgi:hypothetical protein